MNKTEKEIAAKKKVEVERNLILSMLEDGSLFSNEQRLLDFLFEEAVYSKDRLN